ncbi:MAG: alpha/beta hydrolase family protein [Opitutales bacterium]
MLSLRTGLLLCSILLSFICSTLNAQSGANVQYYPEDFTRRLGYVSATLGFDGKYIHGIERYNDSTYIVNLRLEDGHFARTDIRGLNTGDEIIRINMASETQLLLQSQQGYLYSFDLDDRQATLIFDPKITLPLHMGFRTGPFAAPRIKHGLPDQPDQILISHQNSDFNRVISYLNIRTGALVPAASSEEDVHEWFVDGQGKIRGKSIRKRTRFEYLYRLSENEDWEEMDENLPHDAEKRLQFSLFKETLAGVGQVFMGFGEQENEVYFASNHKTDTMALYRAFLGSSKPPELVYHDPKFDVAENPGTMRMSGLYPSPFSTGSAALIYEADRSKFIPLESEFGTLLEELSTLVLPEETCIPISYDRDRRHWLLMAYAPHNPGRFILFDRETQESKLIFEINEYLDPDYLAQAKPFELTGSEGQRLHGYYYAPNKPQPSSGYPCVVLLHGGPWFRDTYSYNPQVQVLTSAGFAVLQVNFRGSSGLGFRHLSASAKNYGAAAVVDIAESTQHFISEGKIDPERCAVMGFSYGAYASMYSLAEYPELFCAGVAGAGPYDLVSMTQSVAAKKKVRRIAFEHWQQMVGTNSRRDRPVLEAQSPTHMIDKIQAPIFLYHGLLDQVVAPTQSEHFARLLRAKNKDFSYYPLQGVPHSFGDAPTMNALHHHIIKFLKRQFK